MHELFLISSKLPSSKYLIAGLNILKGKKSPLTKVVIRNVLVTDGGLDYKFVEDNTCAFAKAGDSTKTNKKFKTWALNY